MVHRYTPNENKKWSEYCTEDVLNLHAKQISIGAHRRQVGLAGKDGEIPSYWLKEAPMEKFTVLKTGTIDYATYGDITRVLFKRSSSFIEVKYGTLPYKNDKGASIGGFGGAIRTLPTSIVEFYERPSDYGSKRNDVEDCDNAIILLIGPFFVSPNGEALVENLRRLRDRFKRKLNGFRRHMLIYSFNEWAERMGYPMDDVNLNQNELKNRPPPKRKK